LNVAVTEVLAVRLTVHVLVPVQAPDHPANVEVPLGVAVSVTDVPLAKLAVQVVPQLIPEGLLVIVPAPVPAPCTASWTGGTVLKVAVTVVLAASVKLHAPVPVQPPAHPAKVEPALGVAVRVTAVPGAKLALQVVPQLIPEGLLVTVPVPVPAFFTTS
jgi:hypothetical protein